MRPPSFAVPLPSLAFASCFTPDEGDATASTTIATDSSGGEDLSSTETTSSPGLPDDSTGQATTTGDGESTSMLPSGTTDATTGSDSDTSTGAPVVPPCSEAEFPEGAATFWERDDIAVCPNDDPSTLPATEGGAEALCNVEGGWHLCSDAEARERNDDCTPGGLLFVAMVATGGNDCVLFDNGSPADPAFKCNSDFAREGFAGSCGGAESAAAWGFHHAGETGRAAHGALCCL